jgi:signal transduction histidine kinase
MAVRSEPTSWFLPAERAAAEALAAQVARAAARPLVDEILRSWSGAILILNEARQIVALNACFLEALGVDEPGPLLGLRHGEALGCQRAADYPGGCGTGPACNSCGAALALVAAASRERPEERDCVLAVRRGEEILDLDLRVRASPLAVDGHRFLLMTLADVTAERRRAALERAFFHDLSNLVAGLAGACASLDCDDPAGRAAVVGDVRALTERLAREVQVQKALATARPGALPVAVERVPLARLVEQLRRLFQHHPAAAGKALLAATPGLELVLDTDPFLLQRVLTNMLINAFEATAHGGTVRLDVEERAGGVAVRVWNAGAMPAGVAPRVFQRYFSTKAGEGRGQGTFVMKLFGERLLQGRVSFSSTTPRGTTFELELPRSIEAAAPRWAQEALPG